jgi:hypothetical protein
MNKLTNPDGFIRHIDLDLFMQIAHLLGSPTSPFSKHYHDPSRYNRLNIEKDLYPYDNQTPPFSID